MVKVELLPISACAIGADVADRRLGEPRRFHPLVGFGELAQQIESSLRRTPAHPRWQMISGIVAWALPVLPFAGPAFRLHRIAPHGIVGLLDVASLYFALGAQSLHEHLVCIVEALECEDLVAALEAVGRIVSRDTWAPDESAVARAAIESTLENGNDVVFGALFWFALYGWRGELFFRPSATLDAMGGYRNGRYQRFGYAAARKDDLLGYPPARWCALSYAFLRHGRQAGACWRAQAQIWDSPNTSPAMAAGVGSLGGAALRYGQRAERPALGAGPAPASVDIRRALALVERGIVLRLFAEGVLALASGAARA